MHTRIATSVALRMPAESTHRCPRGACTCDGLDAECRPCWRHGAGDMRATTASPRIQRTVSTRAVKAAPSASGRTAIRQARPDGTKDALPLAAADGRHGVQPCASDTRTAACMSHAQPRRNGCGRTVARDRDRQGGAKPRRRPCACRLRKVVERGHVRPVRRGVPALRGRTVDMRSVG